MSASDECISISSAHNSSIGYGSSGGAWVKSYGGPGLRMEYGQRSEKWSWVCSPGKQSQQAGGASVQ